DRLSAEKVLSVSVVATPEPDWTIDALAADYARCARWAVESGADCIEANFSCPNVATCDGQLFQQPKIAGLVAAALRAALPQGVPLLLKIGHITDPALAEALIDAVSPSADALVMVNTISARVNGSEGLLFDGQPRGIAGPAIREASTRMIADFRRLIDRGQRALQLVGVGGITTLDDVQAYLQAGAHSVQLATAAML